MYINSQSFGLAQGQPQYYRLGTYGDRLWDEKGWLDMSGADGKDTTGKSIEPTKEEPIKQEPKKDIIIPDKTKIALGIGLGILAGMILYYSIKR